MPEYLAPGVYVEEIDTGSKPIEGVSTSTAGMVGVTERGPVGVPILTTSYGEFERIFGGRLNADPFGEHRHLPFAVEGFFTNGGKRLFVVRVLDEAGATRASFVLHARGEAAQEETALLRAAAEGAGTAADRLFVLDGGALAVSATQPVRFGDGSTAEYRFISAIRPAAEANHVPLHLPLGASHDAGALTFDLTLVPIAAAVGYELTEAAEAGDDQVVLSGPGGVAVAAGDIALLVPGRLMRIGGADTGEFRFIRAVDATDDTAVLVDLEVPLGVAHPDMDEVILVSTDPVAAGVGEDAFPSGNPLTVDAPAAAGDTEVVLTEAVAGDLADLSIDDLLRIADAEGGEYRVVVNVNLGVPGANQATVELDDGLAAAYGVGVEVRRVDTTDRVTTLAEVARTGDRVVFVDDRGGDFDTRTRLLLIADGTDREVRRIGDLHELTLARAVGRALGAGTVVEGVTMTDDATVRSLTRAATAGTIAVTLDVRSGLAEGDVLRIGDEFAEIDALPDRAAGGDDPGTVRLLQALQADHPDGEEVRLQTVAPTAGQPTAATLFVAAPDAVVIPVSDGDGYAAGDVVRLTTASGDVFYAELEENADDLDPRLLEVSVPLTLPQTAGAPVAERNAQLLVEALDAGAWGNRLRVSVEDEEVGLLARTNLTTVVSGNQVRLGTYGGVEAGTILELQDPATGDPVDELLKVTHVNRVNGTITLADPLTAAHLAVIAALPPGTQLRVRSREFRITVLLYRPPDPAVPTRNETVLDTEVFRWLSMDPRHSRYVETILGAVDGPERRWDRRPEGESGYVRVDDRGAAGGEAVLHGIRLGPETLRDVLPNGRTRAARHPLSGGDDSVPTIVEDTYVGDDATDPDDRTGLHSLRNVEEVSIVAAPGRVSVRVQGALIEHCELMRYRFAVLDGPPPPSDSLTDVQDQRQQFDTRYAALYHPWPLIREPFPVRLEDVPLLPVPPAGHVIGVYARTDIERGVHKAPANEVVRGVESLSRLLNKAEQDILNPSPKNINVIRDFRPQGRGIRIWGARVITSDPDHKYVPVRRLLIFLEHSLDRGLQWVVFEPNAEPLWARVRQTVTNFLLVVWRNGALEGTKAEQAFFVRCDRTTMTQTDIDNGRLICVVGVAPVKPAEFVIIRIGLKTAEAES